MASKSLAAQTAENDSGRILKEFGECAVALRNVLYQDVALTDAEFLFIENHFRVLEMAYLRWKRKHRSDLSAVENMEAHQIKAH